MTAERAYLDYNASAPLTEAARTAMLSALDLGNPSSVHAEGRQARSRIEEARRDVASLLGADAGNVIFTSGATEAAATLLTPHWRMGRAPLIFSRLYICAADHACIISGGRFSADSVTVLGVDRAGLLDLDGLRASLGSHVSSEGLPLVALGLANNETGVIQPMAEIAAIVKAAGGVLVWDAVQAAGRISLDMAAACGDFFILSAHKLGGPTGVGAYVAGNSLLRPVPLIPGGGQEKGFRAGTENVAGICGFGAAAREALERQATEPARLVQLRDRLEQALLQLDPPVEIHGREATRLPNTSYFTIPGLKAETAQIALDLAGFAVSSGSACSSGKVGPSHVLTAMGVSRREGAVRVSLGASTTQETVDAFVAAISTLVARHRGGAKAA